MPKKLDILVVDDNPEVLKMFEEILGLEGHQVRSFNEGAVAVENFRRCRPDLVISDLGMPEVTGWQVAQLIRDISRDTPIVFITAVGESVDDEKVEELGVLTVLRKPFRLAQIRHILNEIS